MNTAPRFLWVGNDPALDFLNTTPVTAAGPLDLLAGFDDLVEWLVEAELVDARAIAAGRAHWSAAATRRTLQAAHRLRAQLRELVDRRRAGKAAGRDGLAAVNAVLRRRRGHAEVVRDGARYERRWHLELSEPEHLLVPIAEAVADLLCHADPALLKRCENPACVLYFYDVSKNHARRWCSMALCGNRMKVAAHYRRRREGRTQRH